MGPEGEGNGDGRYVLVVVCVFLFLCVLWVLNTYLGEEMTQTDLNDTRHSLSKHTAESQKKELTPGSRFSCVSHIKPNARIKSETMQGLAWVLYSESSRYCHAEGNLGNVLGSFTLPSVISAPEGAGGRDNVLEQPTQHIMNTPPHTIQNTGVYTEAETA